MLALAPSLAGGVLGLALGGIAAHGLSSARGRRSSTCLGLSQMTRWHRLARPVRTVSCSVPRGALISACLLFSGQQS